MRDDDSIGARCAVARNLKGWTQDTLASRAGLSVSILQSVEQGRRVASPQFLTAVATALQVDQASLTGQPYAEAVEHGSITEIRRVIMRYDMPLEPLPPIRDLEAIKVDIAKASRRRQQARLVELGEMLPRLLDELQFIVNTTDGGRRERAAAMLSVAYAAAGQVAYKWGYADLDTLLVERYKWAAERSGDPLLLGVSDWQRAGQFMMVKLYDDALGIIDAAVDGLPVGPDKRFPRETAAYGSLHLKGALIASRAGNRDRTELHLGEARAAGSRVADLRNDFDLMFGRTAVDIYACATAVEAGDGPTAIERSRQLRVPAGYAPERAAHHHIDMGRAYLLVNRRDESLSNLQEAYRIAPQQTRVHPQVRETVMHLGRLERRTSGALREFASRIGLPD